MADLITGPLRALLDNVATARYPAPDGSVTVQTGQLLAPAPR